MTARISINELTSEQLPEPRNRDEERFLAKISISPAGGCWVWTGSTDRGGYGRLRYEGRPYPAHRLAHMWWIGPVAVGLEVMHLCDNPPCVNPMHLRAGTRLDNERDKVGKGRHHNMLKPVCPAGHPYSADNLYEGRSDCGGVNRKCRVCSREAWQRYNAKRPGRGAAR